MHVKGTAWLARNQAMEQAFGRTRWQDVLSRHSASTPFLAAPVTQISRSPVEECLALHDALVEEFYEGDTQAYWRFGETSAEWALQNQLRDHFAPGEGRRFLQFSPTIYKGYFDGGELLVEPQPGQVELIIRGVTPPHVYFEFSIIGFAAGGLRALKTPAEPVCVAGFSRGDAEVRYRFPLAA